jgi:hypothetical protein
LSGLATVSSTASANAGILTMAFGPRRYIRMAKGMVRSLRLHNPGLRVAIISDRDPASLSRWFDEVIPLNTEFGPGLAQKLYLDSYTPFERTLFVDSDFLFYRDPQVVWDHYTQVDGFALVAYPMNPGDAHYAVHDLPSYMAKLGLSRMLMTNTGILYFDRSETARGVFKTAREITARAEELGLKYHPAGFFNDEPVFASAVELLGLPFVPEAEQPLFTLAGLGTDGMMEVDVRRKWSRYDSAGRTFEPALIHFNVGSQESRVYDRELRRLAFGRILGRGRLPGLVTACLWGLRDLLSGLRKAWHRVVGRGLTGAGGV